MFFILFIFFVLGARGQEGEVSHEVDNSQGDESSSGHFPSILQDLEEGGYGLRRTNPGYMGPLLDWIKVSSVETTNEFYRSMGRYIVSVASSFEQESIGIGLNINKTKEELESIVRPVFPATSLLVELVEGTKELDVPMIRDGLAVCYYHHLKLLFDKGYDFRSREPQPK